VSPFLPGGVTERARAAWQVANLERIVLHEARHTFASLMIAAGVNAKALSKYMGHPNISITRPPRAPDARQRGRDRRAA
jgi:integrase